MLHAFMAAVGRCHKSVVKSIVAMEINLFIASERGSSHFIKICKLILICDIRPQPMFSHTSYIFQTRRCLVQLCIIESELQWLERNLEIRYFLTYKSCSAQLRFHIHLFSIRTLHERAA